MCGGYSVFAFLFRVWIELADCDSQYGRFHLEMEDIECFTGRHPK